MVVLIIPIHGMLTFVYFFQKIRADVAGGDCGEAVDGNHKTLVALDALDNAFGAFEQSGGDADAVAFEEFLGNIGQRDEFVADGSYEDEVVHFFLRNGRRMFALRIEVKIQPAPELGDEVCGKAHRAAHKHYAGSEFGAVAVNAVIGQALGDDSVRADDAGGKPLE